MDGHGDHRKDENPLKHIQFVFFDKFVRLVKKLFHPDPIKVKKTAAKIGIIYIVSQHPL